MSRLTAPRSVWLVPIVTALLSACPRGQVDLPPRENRVRSGHLPTPFDAKEIREACPSGHYRSFRIEAAGRPLSYRVLRFGSATEKTVVVHSVNLDAKGRRFGEQRQTLARWKALQAQASFPRRNTTCRTETFRTPVGVFECWRYEVKTRVGDQSIVKRFWFAKKLPGPPVGYEQLQAGKRVFRMMLIAKGRLR